MGINITSVNPVHNAPVELPLARSFPARPPPSPARAGPPSPVLHRAFPSPTPQNTSQGTGNDWKNFPSTTHTDRWTDIVTLIYKMAHMVVVGDVVRKRKMKF
jgi:hypothetical protein